MNKISQKVANGKGPKGVNAGHKSIENFMKRMKENILNDAKKVVEILPIQAIKLPVLLPMVLTIQAMKLPALPTSLPQDLTILIFMALV